MNRTTTIDRPAPGAPQRRPDRSLLVVLVTAVAVLLGGTVWALADDPGPALSGLRILVPNAPGGGYDITARSAARAMEDAGITGPVEVFSLPGAGGVAGLGRIVNERGNDRLTLSMGLGLVGALRSRHESSLLERTTPIARLTREPEVLVVRADSPIRDVGGLLRQWRANPAGDAVGGGSSPGGPDHQAAMRIAERAGIPASRVDYVAHDGGGELLASLLAGDIAFGVSGLGEFTGQVAAGAVRPLAVTSAQRIPGIDAPTLREAGIDVDFANWRGVLAPPGLSDAQRRQLEDAYAALVRTPQWQDVLRRNNWQDAYLPGSEFGTFLREEDARVARLLATPGQG